MKRFARRIEKTKDEMGFLQTMRLAMYSDEPENKKTGCRLNEKFIGGTHNHDDYPV
jgi:hypothetical protein